MPRFEITFSVAIHVDADNEEQAMAVLAEMPADELRDCCKEAFPDAEIEKLE